MKNGTVHVRPADAGSRWRSVAWFCVAVGVPCLVFLGVVWGGSEGEPILQGDGYYYVSIAISLWQDQDLDLENQLPGELTRHSHHVSMDRHGRLVPKHPIFMPIVSLPWLVAFREQGALTFNVLILVAVVCAAYALALRLVARWAAALAILLTATQTFLPRYAWDYSGDLFAVFWILLGLVCLPMRGEGSDARWHSARTLAAGLCVGIGVISKVILIVVPPLCLLLLPELRRLRSAVVLAAGLAGPVAGFALLNVHLFGSPVVTSYDRIAYYEEGEWQTTSHRNDFDLPFLEGARGQLLDRRNGLLPTTPISVVSFALLPFLWRRRAEWAWFCGVLGIGLFLFFCKYRLWHWSPYGNRFLMLPIVLGALPLAATFETLGPRMREFAERVVSPEEGQPPPSAGV